LHPQSVSYATDNFGTRGLRILRGICPIAVLPNAYKSLIYDRKFLI